MTQANLQQTDGTVRPVAVDMGVFAITGATSPKVVTMNNMASIKLVKSVTIISTANVRRGASGAVTFTGNTVSVTDAAFANGETLVVEAIGYNT